MDAIWGIFLAAVLGPCLLAYLNGHQLRAAQRENWRREDLVADRAAEVAAKLLAKQEETAAKAAEAAKLLLQNNALVAEMAEVTNTRLDVIHTLVNSNMTSALQGELDSNRATLALLRELIALHKTQGNEPNEATLAEEATLEANVQRLAANLRDRLEQTKVADAQIFIAKESKLKGASNA